MRTTLWMVFLGLAAAALLLAGCTAVTSGPKSGYDKFTDTVINTSGYNEVDPGLMGGPLIVLDLRQEIKPAGTNYSLVVETLFMPGFGQSLQMVADDQRFEFTRSVFSAQQGNRYFYPATEAQIRAIAAAARVELRIIDLRGKHVDRAISAANRRHYQDFVKRFMP